MTSQITRLSQPIYHTVLQYSVVDVITLPDGSPIFPVVAKYHRDQDTVDHLARMNRLINLKAAKLTNEARILPMHIGSSSTNTIIHVIENADKNWYGSADIELYTDIAIANGRIDLVEYFMNGYPYYVTEAWQYGSLQDATAKMIMESASVILLENFRRIFKFNAEFIRRDNHKILRELVDMDDSSLPIIRYMFESQEPIYSVVNDSNLIISISKLIPPLHPTVRASYSMPRRDYIWKLRQYFKQMTDSIHKAQNI